MTRAWTALAVVALLVLAGCSGGSVETGQVSQAGADGGADLDAAPESTPAADQATVAAVQQDRQLIRTAQARVTVASFDRARDELVSVVEANGGFVGSSTRERRGQGNRTWTEGRLVLRVPADNYSAVIAAVNESGEVVSFQEETRDVTEQVVDLEARLENLRAERDQLRRLFEQANDTEDVLAVQERLSDVQEEIERTEARLTQLRRQVALATITVRLAEEPPEREEPDRDRWFDTPLAQAFAESVSGVVTTIRATGVLFAFALPYLLAFGLPLVAVAAGVRRFRRGRRARTPPDRPVADDTDETVSSDADDTESNDDTD